MYESFGLGRVELAAGNKSAGVEARGLVEGMAVFTRERAIFGGEMDAEGAAGFFEQTRHAEGKSVGDDGTFTKSAADEVAEVGGLIVKSAAGVGRVNLDNAAIEVMNGGV